MNVAYISLMENEFTTETILQVDGGYAHIRRQGHGMRVARSEVSEKVRAA